MCVLCKSDKHPLFVCPKFKSLHHEQMVSTIREHSLFMNCLKPGHFVTQKRRLRLHLPVGESRSQAVKRFLTLERSLEIKGKMSEFSDAVQEYFTSGHAEEVPHQDLSKPPKEVYYHPMHHVFKQSSSTTKVRVVFDASAKSSTDVSLNNLLLVGPTVHSPLLDALLRFRLYRVTLIADVSSMYRAVRLCELDKDLHRFVWMTCVTFGSPFAANMAVHKSFYVDDCLSGADTISDATEMHTWLQNIFEKGGFVLHKWNSSERSVLDHISAELIDDQSVRLLTDPQQYTKTLGIQWNFCTDSLRLEVHKPNQQKEVTKCSLVSEIGKIFNVLGWFSPTIIIKAKMLL